jgi:hypothetical protein
MAARGISSAQPPGQFGDVGDAPSVVINLSVHLLIPVPISPREVDEIGLEAARLGGLVMHGVMPSDSGKRLLLNVLLKGLADATHRNDRSTVGRYRRRLHLVALQVADQPVQDALKRVLLVSDLWIEAAEVDRDETAQQMLKLIDRGIGLLHRPGPSMIPIPSSLLQMHCG